MAYDLPSNFSNGTSVNGIGSLLQYAQYATGEWFGTGILAVIFLMVLGVSALANMGRAWAAASFVTLVFSVYMVRIDLVSSAVPFILLTFTIIGFFWAKSERTSTY